MGFLRIGRLPGTPISGGFSQMGLQSTAPFMDFTKSSYYDWTYRAGAEANYPCDPSDRDDTGMPMSILSGSNGHFTRIDMPPLSTFSSNVFVMTWDGTGTMLDPSGGNILSGSLTSTGSGRITFALNTALLYQQSVFPSITAMSAYPDHIRNVKIFHIDDEDAVNAGRWFRPQYITKLQELNCRTIRTMDWGQNNISKVTRWSDRKPLTYCKFGMQEWRAEWQSPSTIITSSNGRNAFTLAWSGFTLDHHRVVQVRWNQGMTKIVSATSNGVNTDLAVPTTSDQATFQIGDVIDLGYAAGGTWTGLNGSRTVTAVSSGVVQVNVNSSAFTGSYTANSGKLSHKLSTLNIESTGAINIIAHNCAALSIGGNSHIIADDGRCYSTLIYDEDLNAFIKYGGDIAFNAKGMENGYPPELTFMLAEEVGAHPWSVVPALANETYEIGLGEYGRDNTSSWSINHIEGPNEIFNSFAGFHSNGYAIAKQAVVNGVKRPAGIPVVDTYSVSAVADAGTVGGVACTNVTLTPSGNTFIAGSYVDLNAFPGMSGSWSSAGSVFVHAVNIGGNPDVIQLERTFTAGYTSGGTITPNVNGYNLWYGEKISTIGVNVSTAYAGDETRYEAICGVQTGGGTAAQDQKLASRSWVLRGGSRAADYVTAIATAQYYGPEIDMAAETTALAAWAPVWIIGYVTGGDTLHVSSFVQGSALSVGMEASYVGTAGAVGLYPRTTLTAMINSTTFTIDPPNQTAGSISSPVTIYLGDPATRRAAEDDFVVTAKTGTRFSLAITTDFWPSWATWANSFGVKKMLGYEGGYSPDMTNNDARLLTSLFREATKASSLLYDYTIENYENYIYADCADDFEILEPSCYFFLGDLPSGSVWSIYQTIDQDPTPQALAIAAFNDPGGYAVPVNVTAPTIDGLPIPGNALTCSKGRFTGGALTFSFQWKLDGAAIVGATDRTYVSVAGDIGHNIECAVAVSNGQGSLTETSNSLTINDPSINFCGSSHISGGVTTHSATVDIGPAANDRLIIVAFDSQNAPTVSSVTVDGVMLTLSEYTNANPSAGIYYGIVDSSHVAGNATVTVNYVGASGLDRSMYVWRLNGLVSGSRKAVGSFVNFSTMEIAADAGDIVIAVGRSTATVTFNGSDQAPTDQQTASGSVDGSAAWLVQANDSAFRVVANASSLIKLISFH